MTISAEAPLSRKQATVRKLETFMYDLCGEKGILTAQFRY
jgi:hypothetical protein